MTTQFDLEQEIMACWNVTSDLDVLFESVMENDELTKDNIANIVLGMQELYELKFDKCFRTFETFIQEYYAFKQQVESSQCADDLNFQEDEEEHLTNTIREQYHEELSGMSDDEIVRTIREQYGDVYAQPTVVNVTDKD